MLPFIWLLVFMQAFLVWMDMEHMDHSMNLTCYQGGFEMDFKKVMTVLVLIVVPVVAQSTNGYFSHGTGLINRALGGAGVAFPQDALASATNPGRYGLRRKPHGCGCGAVQA